MTAADAPIECDRCGQTHRDHRGRPGCTGHISSGPRKGEPCTKSRRRGQSVCDSHGGRARQNVAAAERRQHERVAAEAVETLGLPVDISPTDALLEEVRWTAGHVRWLRRKVQELQDRPSHAVTSLTDGSDLGYGDPRSVGALTWGTTKVTTGDSKGTTQEARPSIWYDLYARERDHLVKVSQAAIRAGVEERRVRLAEQQGELVGNVIMAILADLGLSPEQQTRVGEVVPRHLRLLTGGAA